jgi:chemotaxis protein methyltransferase CheR
LAVLDRPQRIVVDRSASNSEALCFELPTKTITPQEFLNFQTLIYQASGIWLSSAKTALLVGRLSKHLRRLGLRSFTEYFRVVCEDQHECTQMLDTISTNETRFFREPDQFSFLEQRILPHWVAAAYAGNRGRKVQVWSAGCSTGQEPYSLAMTLQHHLPPSAGWDIEIVATDLSTQVLEKARAGTWDLEKSKEIPDQYLKAFMLRGYGEQKNKMKAGPEIRSLIRFFQLNLNDAKYPVYGKFDLIFCRNVLIYFDLETRTRVIQHLLEHLSQDGFLFVGHAESLHTMSGVLRRVVPTIYTRIPKTQAAE